MLKSKGHACAVTRIDGKDVIVVSGGYKDLGELNGNLLDSVELMYEGKDFFKRGKNSLIFKISCQVFYERMCKKNQSISKFTVNFVPNSKILFFPNNY